MTNDVPEAQSSSSIRLPGYVFGAAGAVAGAGTFLAWLTGPGGSVSGLGQTTGSVTTDGGFGPGSLLLTLGAVIAILGSLRGQLKAPRATSIAGIVVSAIAVLLLIAYYSVNVESNVSAGIGLWISILGAVVALGGSIWALIKRT